MNRLPWGGSRPAAPRRGRWTQDEIAHLQDGYGLRDVEIIARELARKPESVRRQAAIVCRGPAHSGPWTEGEVSELKRYLGLANVEVIASILGRKVDEVSEEIEALGRIRHEGPWSREDKHRLKMLYGSRSDEHIARIVARSVEDVRAQADELRLAKDKVFQKRQRQKTRMPRWDRGALEQLRERYPRESNIELARSIGRTVKSIVSKAHQLGLRKEVERLRQMGRENVRLRYEATR